MAKNFEKLISGGLHEKRSSPCQRLKVGFVPHRKRNLSSTTNTNRKYIVWGKCTVFDC
jgi:hypothetical protein